MSKAKVSKRSKVKPFIKVVNYNHIMYENQCESKEDGKYGRRTNG